MVPDYRDHLSEGAWMLFVKLGEQEYLPFLRNDSIKLKDSFSNSVLLSETTNTQFYVREIGALVDTQGLAWFVCDYSRLRSLLEHKNSEIDTIRERVFHDMVLA